MSRRSDYCGQMHRKFKQAIVLTLGKIHRALHHNKVSSRCHMVQPSKCHRCWAAVSKVVRSLAATEILERIATHPKRIYLAH
jgi:hypothetical protein